MSSRHELKRKAVRRARRKHHVRKTVYGVAERPRLTVFRSHKHISCQLIDDRKGVTLAAASTQGKDVREILKGFSGNVAAARVVGRVIADKGKALGLKEAQFDRNGYRFHGRVKALVEAAREAGLKI